MSASRPHLHKTLSGLEYFTFGFGTMVGVGWLVLIDDWLSRGGPGGVILGFAIGGLLLLPVARTYGRLVKEIPDAGSEVAYAEGVFPKSAGFACAWTMVLSYAIVCPWEAVAVGNLFSRVFPGLNSHPLYELAGKTIYAPRLLLGLILTAAIMLLNWRGIRGSSRFQNATTLTLLALFALFVLLGFSRGHLSNAAPLFAGAGVGGAALSILLTLQIVPYFLTGFESVGKGSEEARDGFDPSHFGRAITGSLAAGAIFYVAIVAAVSLVFPWKDLVEKHLGTEAAFSRAFGSSVIAKLVIFAAFLSLLKIFNGNFVASTRLLFGLGKRGLVHPSLSRVHPKFETPSAAILLMAVLTAAASFFGDALLVPVSEVGSLAVGVGWCSACVAYLLRARPDGRIAAGAGALVSAAVVAMKIVPVVPGSFTRPEWIAFAGWSGLGLALWFLRSRAARVPA